MQVLIWLFMHAPTAMQADTMPKLKEHLSGPLKQMQVIALSGSRAIVCALSMCVHLCCKAGLTEPQCLYYIMLLLIIVGLRS